MAQHYAVSCASGTNIDALVQAQCDAVPLDCTQPSPIARGQSIAEIIANAVSAVPGVRLRRNI